MRTLLLLSLSLICYTPISAQSALSFNYAPYQFSIDFQTFFNKSDHGLELGIFGTGRNQVPLFTDKRSFHPAFELLYQHKLFKVGKGGVGLLGLGPRLDYYIHFDGADGGLSIPASFQWTFEEYNAMARIRLTGVIGTYLDVIPSLGISFKF